MNCSTHRWSARLGSRRDAVFATMITRYDFAVAVGPAVPVREISHLLAWLRANPEQANFGVPATGSLPHFFSLMIGEATANLQLIARAVEASMKEPALQEKLRAAKMIPVSASQAQTARMLTEYRAKWEPIIKASGFRE